MTNADILKQMGLTDSELRDLLHKTNTYFNSLSKAQKDLVLSSQHNREEAAATLRGDVSVSELEKFLLKHGHVNDFAVRWCKACHDQDDDEEAAEDE